MSALTTVSRDKNFLSKEIMPFHSMELFHSWSKHNIIQNPDPVLTYLVNGSEEAYRIAERNNGAIGAAREKRDSTLLSQGSRIICGRSKSKYARKLQDLTIKVFKQIKSWHLVQMKIQDAFYWGWRPMEVIWDTNFRWERKTLWVPHKFIDKKPEFFRFTANRDLAYLNRQTGEYTVYSDPLEKLKWFICTYNSIDNPYGNAIYQRVWLAHFAKDRFFEMFASGMQRSMGLIKLKEGITHPTSDRMMATLTETALSSEIIGQVSSEIRDIISLLNSHNVLIERSGWEIEFVNNINFASGWISAMEYIDKTITEIIATESLSWKESEFGSRAQAVVHSQSGKITAMGDGRVRDEWINEGIIEQFIKFNFGDVDPDDMPRHQSYATIPLDFPTVKQASEMGMDQDLDEIAYRFNIPVADETTARVLKGNIIGQRGPTEDGEDMNPKRKVQQEDEESRKDAN